MRRPIRFAVLAAIALVKMPYRGERNLADQGWRVRPVSTVALTPDEQKAYGEWNRLGLANGHLAQVVAAELKEGRFPVGLLANCSALMGMLGGLQHAGKAEAPPETLNYDPRPDAALLLPPSEGGR